MRAVSLIFILFCTGFISFGCGVKGAPLPPENDSGQPKETKKPLKKATGSSGEKTSESTQ